MNSLEDLLQTARDAARAAAEIHRRSGGESRPLAASEKGHSDWVSAADRAAEEAAVAEIRRRFPDHAIVAEEGDWGGPAVENAPVVWYVDPLDGTTNYLHGYPTYAASVAATDAEGLAAAVVINSARSEVFEAARGHGAQKDGRLINVSATRSLKHALIGTGFPFKKTELLDEYLAHFRAILPATSGIRRTGSAAIDLCDLACGRLDGFWELVLAPWDVAAGVLIVREAGGRVTDLEGREDVVKHGPIVAGSPAVHDLLHSLIESASG